MLSEIFINILIVVMYFVMISAVILAAILLKSFVMWQPVTLPTDLWLGARIISIGAVALAITSYVRRD